MRVRAGKTKSRHCWRKYSAIRTWLVSFRVGPNTCGTRFSSGVLSSIPRFEIRGFETQQEQIQAAKVYMDKRGISRPGVPWLAPEFVNPLFLRSACIALAQDKKSEFPAWPHGNEGNFGILRTKCRSQSWRWQGWHRRVSAKHC